MPLEPSLIQYGFWYNSGTTKALTRTARNGTYMRHCLKALTPFTGLFVLVAISTVTAAAQTVAPAGSATAMIIFDGSGSMWGRLDGDAKKTKLDLARDALRQSLGKTPAGARLGLMSFGHRRSGDCSDVEVIVPAGDGDTARILAPLDKLNPRGKGPLSGAIREAAKALAATPDASIVLIHDNADNCRQDPCDAASEIAEANPKLKIHLVPLGLDRDELSRSVCISKITGGQVFEARDAAGVQAAVSAAVALALLDAGGSGDTKSAAEAAPPPASTEVQGPTGLRLTARLGAAPVPAGTTVRWRLTKPDDNALVFEGAGNPVTVPLDTGPYEVEVHAGFAAAKTTATAAGTSATAVDIALEAGELRLLISDLKDGPPSQTAMVTLSSKTETKSAATRPIWIGPARDADLVLPAGLYKLRITDSLFEREETITLAAGDSAPRGLVLGAGHLELTAVAKTDGPPLDGVTFTITRDDPDSPTGRRELARSAAVRPAFTLPAGTYYVTARAGPAEVRQRVGIGAGDTIKQTLVLGLAKLAVSADIAGASSSGAGGVTVVRPSISTRVLALSGPPREIARSNAVAPEFTLAAGRYRVEAAVGTLNVKASQDIELEASSVRRVALKLDSGIVTLKLSTPVPGSSGMTWEVKDSQGRLVVRTQQSAPRLVLAPGRYVARCEADDRRVEKQIDVVADAQPGTIDFALP